MNLQDLRSEYEESLVGDLIYSRVRKLVGGLLQRRDPRVYAQGSHTSAEGADDMCNEFFVQVLIGGRQLDYIFQVATDIEDFNRLVYHHAKRFLGRARAKTVIDNLIARSIRLLTEPPFRSVGQRDGSEIYGLIGVTYRPGSEAESADMRRAVALAHAVRTDKSDASERAPRVYGPVALADVITILVQTVQAPVSQHDLQDFFGQLLTAWVTRFLEHDGEVPEHSVGYSPEEEAVIKDVAQRALQTMDEKDRIIFAYKYANLPDRLAAERIGLSRPPTASRKDALFARLREELDELDDPLREGVLAEIAAELAHLRSGGSE